MGNYTVIQRPSMLVVGIECRTFNAPEAGSHDIPQHWGKFYNEDIINQIPNKVSQEVIALYCDYADAYKEGDYTQPYSLVIGCPVSSLDAVPEGMVAKIIPSGSYAVFRAVGEYPKNLLKTWENIWQQADLGRICTSDYEIYGDKFISGSPKEVEVFISVKDQN
ncbi:MAG: GyrI-like domain-containing protein [Candidatus Rhabdochlamydia sp.]